MDEKDKKNLINYLRAMTADDINVRDHSVCARALMQHMVSFDLPRSLGPAAMRKRVAAKSRQWVRAHYGVINPLLLMAIMAIVEAFVRWWLANRDKN